MAVFRRSRGDRGLERDGGPRAGGRGAHRGLPAGGCAACAGRPQALRLGPRRVGAVKIETSFFWTVFLRRL